MKILLAVDGSAFTKHMLAYLAAHDELLDEQNSFTALTVVAPLPAQVTHFIDKKAIDGYHAEAAQAVLRPIETFAAHHGWNVVARHAVGHAAQTISEFATEGRFDMVVMGSHGHSALTSLVTGSVTTAVLARCKTPLLVIR